MTIEEFNQQKELTSDDLNKMTYSEDHKDQIKELFIRLFDMYLKKELGWRHTDDFKKVVNEL
jgi:hypothetical protein